MREIKFRAYDKDNKVMLEKSFTLAQIAIGMVDVGACDFLQFTGLKDKNGKEIYEGDYVKVNNENILEIVWCNGAFKYMECKSMIDMKFGDGWLHQLQIICQCANPIPQKNLEIIGNIYENPELLTNK